MLESQSGGRSPESAPDALAVCSRSLLTANAWTHPLWNGNLPTKASQIRACLEPFRVERTADLAGAVEANIAAGGTSLIEVPIGG